jgi:hypothetical protein
LNHDIVGRAYKLPKRPVYFARLLTDLPRAVDVGDYSVPVFYLYVNSPVFPANGKSYVGMQRIHRDNRVLPKNDNAVWARRLDRGGREKCAAYHHKQNQGIDNCDCAHCRFNLLKFFSDEAYGFITCGG